MSKINTLVRETIGKMSPYLTPPILPVPVKLNQNESPYNLPPELLEEFSKRIAQIDFNRYNEGSSRGLRERLGRKFRVPPEQVILGCGIDEILYYLMMVFVERGDKVVRPTPSFGMYEICAQVSGAQDVPVQLDERFELTERFVQESKDAKVTFICRPNNPTGNSWSKDTIERVIQRTRGLVVIDEAYVEFAQDNCEDFLKYDNVVLLRTFSKAGSFAGGRLGFALANPEVIEYLNRVRLPWNISIMAQVLGEILLDNELVFAARIERIKKDREALLASLRKMVKVFPTDCNFFIFGVENPKKVFEKLVSLGVLVRNTSKYPLLGNCLRANVGTPEENERLVGGLIRAVSPIDAVIFDIDGVLINVSESYRQAIIRTVRKFAGKEITNADIDRLKSVPGFNNDWDATYALAVGILDPSEVKRESDQYRKMKAYFQMQYLDELIRKEKPLVKLETLEILAQRGLKFAVATSRPREEALFALRNAGVSPQYIAERNIIAQEDAPEKPSPEPLRLAKTRVAAENPVYVGDTSSDKLAAGRAGMLFIFCKPKPDFEYIEIVDVNQLPRVI